MNELATCHLISALVASGHPFTATMMAENISEFLNKKVRQHPNLKGMLPIYVAEAVAIEDNRQTVNRLVELDFECGGDPYAMTEELGTHIRLF